MSPQICPLYFSDNNPTVVWPMLSFSFIIILVAFYHKIPCSAAGASYVCQFDSAFFQYLNSKPYQITSQNLINIYRQLLLAFLLLFIVHPFCFIFCFQKNIHPNLAHFFSRSRICNLFETWNVIHVYIIEVLYTIDGSFPIIRRPMSIYSTSTSYRQIFLHFRETNFLSPICLFEILLLVMKSGTCMNT